MSMTANRAEHDAIPEQALIWAEEGQGAGKGAALATVLQTWGSAPRPTGAQLAVSAEGLLAGSVSGGCVEGAVAAEAMEAIEDGKPRILTFGVSDDDAFAVGLACGGTIRVLVEPIGVGGEGYLGLPLGMLRELVAARAERRAVALLTDVESWERRLVARGVDFGDAFRSDRSGFVDEAETKFLCMHNPPLRLAIVGAVHIAQALAPMARLVGYDVSLIDPRGAFASESRFPGETISEDWPDAALETLGLDARTAVVCLTHDPKLDDPALMRALTSEAFYIGALGSKRTHAKRVERLTADGMPERAMSRLHAPIGLDINAKSPGEIAVAILAQITARLRSPEPGR